MLTLKEVHFDLADQSVRNLPFPFCQTGSLPYFSSLDFHLWGQLGLHKLLGNFLASSRISSNVLHSEQFPVFYQF